MKVDTLQNLDVQDGDVLVCHTSNGMFTHGAHYVVHDGGLITDDYGVQMTSTNSKFSIKKRALREWQDMTEQEQNEIAGHYARGGEVEVFVAVGTWWKTEEPTWRDNLCYRIKQKPVIKTMLIDVVDGEPDMNTLRAMDE